jgi:hypothetical protein
MAFVHRDRRNSCDERMLRLGVGLTVKVVYLRQLSLLALVFCGDFFMGAKIVPKSNGRNPLRTAKRDQVKMVAVLPMCSIEPTSHRASAR